MSSKLGRNPFDKAAKRPMKILDSYRPEPVRDEARKVPKPLLSPKILHRAIIDVPAQAFVLGLGIVMLAKDVFESRG
jgi:hypothetical protein